MNLKLHLFIYFEIECADDILAVAFNDNSDQFLVGGKDGIARLYSIYPFVNKNVEYKGHNECVTAVSFVKIYEIEYVIIG